MVLLHPSPSPSSLRTSARTRALRNPYLSICVRNDWMITKAYSNCPMTCVGHGARGGKDMHFDAVEQRSHDTTLATGQTNR